MYEDAPSSGSDARGRPEAGDDGGLLVVSNRQPYRHTYDATGDLEVDRPAGGLTAGLDPAVQDTGGTWVAWGDGEADREAVDGDDTVEVPPEDPSYTIRRIWLDDAEVAGYYRGFSNQVLWPICHSALATVRAEANYWPRYREVNDRFAGVVADQHEADTPIWLHDYHLALAPRMIRDRLGPEPTLMHFWHIPWPGWETFRACPNAESLIGALLANDLLGFHLWRYAGNFVTCVEAALPEATVDLEAGRIRHDGHVTRLAPLPMGVRTDRLQRQATSEAARHIPETLQADHGIDDVRLGVGVDRLDYTKGIPERLRAIERFFERSPRWRGEFTYLQVGTESRSGIPAYRDVQERVEAAVDRVNDRFGTDDWRPVVFTTDWISPEELAGIYRHADVGIVSSIRDGMNLVAQEFVAAQVDAGGALLLSDRTGAHDLLGDLAVSLRPHDVESFAEAIGTGLTMEAGERRRRMRGLRRRVASIDLSWWTDTFLRRAASLTARPSPARTA